MSTDKKYPFTQEALTGKTEQSEAADTTDTGVSQTEQEQDNKGAKKLTEEATKTEDHGNKEKERQTH